MPKIRIIEITDEALKAATEQAIAEEMAEDKESGGYYQGRAIEYAGRDEEPIEFPESSEPEFAIIVKIKGLTNDDDKLLQWIERRIREKLGVPEFWLETVAGE